jgi:hypothetical protein
MIHNPALVDAVARARVADLRQSARSGVRGRGIKRRHRGAEAARQATGWLLVDMGLRLAVPRRAASRPAPGKQW